MTISFFHSPPFTPRASLIARVVLMACVVILTACNQTVRRGQIYYGELSDRIQDTAAVNPEANIPFIDSLETNSLIPTAVADYFRANAYYPMRQYRVVEFYSKKALNSDTLFNVWPKAYYICSRNLSNNLFTKGDHDGALSYATKAYDRAVRDDSPDAQLNAPGLLLFISLCQRAIGKEKESERNFDLCYMQSLEQIKKDTSFNASFHFAHNTLSVLMALRNDTSKILTDLWIRRSEDAVDHLYDVGRRQQVSKTDLMLCDNTTAMVNLHKAQILYNQGFKKKAEQAYQAFMKSDYAKSPGGIVGQYNYMRAAQRWEEAIALIPAVEAVKSRMDRVLNLDYLKDLQTMYQLYENTNQPHKAMEVAHRMMEKLDTVVRNQQLSTAAELATVFEIQQKERMISEQQNEIAHQRVLAIGVSLLLIVIFFGFFTIHRQRAETKLKKEHQKLQNAYQMLTVANERAEEASKMKTSFIKQISHEIRTPLNVLSGFTQVLTTEDYELDPETRKDISKRMIENTGRITEIVKKMLELSEASSHSPIQRNAQVAISTIIKKATKEPVSHLTPDVTFKMVDETDNIVLQTHEQHAVRALSLILDNARKFTDKGSITLTIRKTEDAQFVAFIVEDTGIGIPAKEVEHIFEEFVQLDEYKEGTGIGLTVARSFAQQLGGDVVLDTTYTAGARFIMTLPLT